MTNPPLVARRKLLGASTETTKGTAETVSAALSGTIVYDATMLPEGNFDDGQRLANLSSSGSLPRVRSHRNGRCTFMVDVLPGDATLTTLLLGCGYKSATGGLTPTTVISDQNTLTIALWEGGRKKVLRGAMGTCTFSAGGPGQRLRAKFNFQGIFQDVTDEAMPSDVFPTASSYTAQNMTLTLASSSFPPIGSFTLNLGQTVQPRQDLTADGGIGYFVITDHVPTLSLGIEARTVANYDAFGKFLGGTAEALQMVLADSTGTGATEITFDAPQFQRTSIGDEDRDGKLTDPVEGELHVSSGNDQLTISEA